MSRIKDNSKVKTQHVYQHNVYLKQMNFDDPNITYCGHHHDYDHVTLVASGSVRVKFAAVPEAGIPEEYREYKAVSTFVTRSFREHEITSLEPNTVVCCVHAVREENGEIIVPHVDEEHRHDPDHKFQSAQQVADTVGAKSARWAFDATLQDKDRMFKRAEKEGTLKEGSQDDLI